MILPRKGRIVQQANMNKLIIVFVLTLILAGCGGEDKSGETDAGRVQEPACLT